MGLENIRTEMIQVLYRASKKKILFYGSERRDGVRDKSFVQGDLNKHKSYHTWMCFRCSDGAMFWTVLSSAPGRNKNFPLQLSDRLCSTRSLRHNAYLA